MSLPKNLKKIGNFAFQDCILENIVIPDTITYLGKLSLFGAISVILDGKVPSGLIRAIAGTYRYNDEDYYGETDDSKKPNYTEVSYNGNKIFIPRSLKMMSLITLTSLLMLHGLHLQMGTTSFLMEHRHL